MIETIQIVSAATYGATPTVLSGLGTFNYFYGANGSGKTTISRIIANAGAFPSCSMSHAAGRALEAMVYNRDFVEKHFRMSDELPGIFTLGAKNAETINKIDRAKLTRDKLIEDIARLKITLIGEDGKSGKKGDLSVQEELIKDACWKQKQDYDAEFKMAFEGFRGSSEKFKSQILQERVSNKAESKPIKEISAKAAQVFSNNLSTYAAIESIAASALKDCETSTILTKKIIGKSDVDIASLIQSLGCSDWIKTGRIYLESSDDKCPFCQQPIPAALCDQLNAYFDETFERDSQLVSDLVSKHSNLTTQISVQFDVILEAANEFMDLSEMGSLKKQFESLVVINKQRLHEKVKELSRHCELESSQELLEKAQSLIAATNIRIKEHNAMVANLEKERSALKAQVWRYLIDVPLKDALTNYDASKNAIGKAISSLNDQIKAKEDQKRLIDREIQQLEKQITSIQPTVNGINSLLNSFGFHGFTLSQAGDKPCYKLIRSDGSDAKETLSEGEKTFVTFLYFYHLLRGSASESGATTARVVVFDDPVSSLDSDILFIVSSLIRKICEEVTAGSTNVKQVFMLTHNVYFHKEVCFNNNKVDGREVTFWTVHKVRGETQIKKHATNPIKSSYELLWIEVRDSRPGNLSIQNTLRRILENYFKMLGGINMDKMHERFEGNEKLACRALTSWINDGSHSAHDDLYIAVDDSVVAIYLDVFRRIFEELGHIEHYNMMMGVAPTTPSASAA